MERREQSPCAQQVAVLDRDMVSVRVQLQDDRATIALLQTAQSKALSGSQSASAVLQAALAALITRRASDGPFRAAAFAGSEAGADATQGNAPTTDHHPTSRQCEDVVPTCPATCAATGGTIGDTTTPCRQWWTESTPRGGDGVVNGDTLAHHVPYLQREFDSVMRTVLSDRAWVDKLAGEDTMSVLLAMLAVHSEYVASTLLVDWLSEQQQPLATFGACTVSTRSVAGMLDEVRARQLHVPPQPTGDVVSGVPPNRPGECWREGGRTKKDRAKRDRLQGLCELDMWEVIGGTPADVTHAWAATLVASVLNPIQLSFIHKPPCAPARPAFIDFLATDMTRWQQCGGGTVDSSETTFVYQPQPPHTFRDMTRSPTFKGAAARVQQQGQLSEEVVTAACWLLDSSKLASKPLTITVHVDITE